MDKRIAIPIIVILVVGLIAAGCLYIQESDKLRNTQTKITALEGNISSLEGNVFTLEADLADKTKTLEIAQTQIFALEGNTSSLEGNVSSLEDDLVGAQNALEVQQNISSALSGELEKVKYPRHFGSLAELTDWLRKDDTDTRHAGEDLLHQSFVLQVRALRDGFLLPVSIQSTPEVIPATNRAVIEGAIYMIWPSDDSISRLYDYIPHIPSRPISPVEPGAVPRVGPEASFGAIDSHALNAPGSGWACVESLAVYLTEPARNDLEIARVISRWIAQNVSYDTEDYLDETFRRDQDPEAVLLRGYTVCEGYARLFEALAYTAGLEAAYLTGWLKGVGHEISEPIGDHLYHAWNAVRIDGRWYLLDLTGADDDYSGRFEEFYFLTCPAGLIYSHFPRNPDWQLLETPIAKQEFAELPRLGPAFFRNGLELVTHTQSVIRTEQQVTIDIMVPENILLFARLEQDDQKLARSLTFVQREGEKYRIDAVFPDAGDYILRIFARHKEDEEHFEWVLDYKIIVSEGMSGPIGFPETFGMFYEQGVFLHTPRSGYLQSGTTEKFKLRVPGAQSVAVIIGDQWHHLTRYGELFEANINILKGEIGVYAKFPNQTHYDGLLRYTGL